MSEPLVSCLCATYGRFSFLREALDCFLKQDYENRELIILNNHPMPLIVSFPKVKIVNLAKFYTLGDCRNALFSYAKGELIRTWDDDDLYFPWAISQGVKGMLENPDAPAWKPKVSWSWRVDRDKIELSGNAYEASWTIRKRIVSKYGYLPTSGGNEHKPLSYGIQAYEGGIVRGDVKPSEMSYVYRWGTGLTRISGTLGDKRGIRWRTNRWKKGNDDHGNREKLEPSDITGYLSKFEKIAKGMEKGKEG